LESRKPTAAEIKAEVEMHLQNKDVVEAVLPASIVVGPFYINTEGVRQGLSKKRKQLANAVLDLLAKKLRTQAEEVCMMNKSCPTALFFLANCKA
jgi:dynein heavy chain